MPTKKSLILTGLLLSFLFLGNSTASAIVGFSYSPYDTVTLADVSSFKILLQAKPISFSDGKWKYEISWNRIRNSQGSFYLAAKSDPSKIIAKSDPAPQNNVETPLVVTLDPATRYFIKFYSLPSSDCDQGDPECVLIVPTKYFTTLDAPGGLTVIPISNTTQLGSGVVGGSACPATQPTLSASDLSALSHYSSLTDDQATALFESLKTFLTQLVDYSARCRHTPPPTSQLLWWYDNTTTVCAQKQFTGTYMYQGLHTFASLDECNASLHPVTPTTPLTFTSGPISGGIYHQNYAYHFGWTYTGENPAGWGYNNVNMYYPTKVVLENATTHQDVYTIFDTSLGKTVNGSLNAVNMLVPDTVPMMANARIRLDVYNTAGTAVIMTAESTSFIFAGALRADGSSLMPSQQ